MKDKIADMFRTGYAKHHDADAAVRMALKGVGDLNPTLLLVLVGGKHDADEVLLSLQMVFPGVPIVGGSVAGVITPQTASYGGFEIGTVAFLDESLTPVIRTASLSGSSDENSGRSLGFEVQRVATENSAVLLLYPSVISGRPRQLHYASRIIAGFEDGLNGKHVELVGGGLLVDADLNDAWAFDGSSIRRDVLTALVFPESFRLLTGILHGCRPTGPHMRITELNEAEILQIDDRPALSVLCEMLQIRPEEAVCNLPLKCTLGKTQSNPFSKFDATLYVNRLLVSCDIEKGSFTLFEPDFAVGDFVQLMQRDLDFMLKEAGESFINFAKYDSSNEDGFFLYIDCIGRAGAAAGSSVEEALLVLAGLPQHLPAIGFYSGVEIAPILGYAKSLDWTGVVAKFSVVRA